ncbi:unknown [Clostridium sp. CAG:307]|nr:unknown [Clostridium sp. CAG:307]
MLQYKFVHILECDICKRKEISTEGLQVDFVARAREVGWIVGTTTAYCPYCVKVQGMRRTPKEPRQLSIFDDELENLEEREEEFNG